MKMAARRPYVLSALDNDQPLTFGLLIESRLARDKNFGQQRSATEKFVDEFLREGKDKAFLIHFDSEVELLQDFTSSRQKLDTAVNSLQARAESSSGRERQRFPAWRSRLRTRRRSGAE